MDNTNLFQSVEEGPIDEFVHDGNCIVHGQANDFHFRGGLLEILFGGNGAP